MASNQHSELAQGERSSENVVATPAPAPSNQHKDHFAVIRAELIGLGREAYGSEIPETSGTAAALRRLDSLEEQLEALDAAARRILDAPKGTSHRQFRFWLMDALGDSYPAKERS